ncbi:MAG TPA: TonB-dependent receptor [Candidatus Acidoferrales bacterium]|nr:TonB-dependent receptor [Candidatus Acidoferrales bacterium]
MRRRYLTLFLIAFPVFAQDRAAINGTVTDVSGALVTNATVELKSAETGLQRATLTDHGGRYQITPLPVGIYALTIGKVGFRPTTVNHIELEYSETRTIDARLEVGRATDTVEVSATAEAVNRTNAEVGAVIEPEQIKEIPVSGRNWASLSLLAPGAINYGDGAQRSIRFAGHSLDDSNFTFDGVDTSGVQEQTQKADTRLNIALDSISEFRVSTSNYTAETGAAGGAQVNVVSKTGTDEFHGSTFYAVRNDALDARSPFDGATLPPFTLNQFGASFGGAIVKDKAFFYANYEGLRQSLGQTFINFVPNAAFRAQVLKTSPVLKPILDAYPAGQTPVDSVTDQVTAVATDTIREDAGMLRFDYRFDNNNTMFFRYNVDNAYIDTPVDALGDHNVIPHIPTNVVLQYQRIISPRTVNEVKFGINRANYHNYGYGTSPVAVSPGTFDGVSDTSLDTEVGTSFSWIDNLTLVRGRHTLKFGAEIRRIRLNNSGNTLTTSSITYATNNDFINNVADSATYLQGEGVAGSRHTLAAGYAQDEFRVSPNLTLNLGLRYEYYSVVHEILNRSAVVDITGCGGFCSKGTPYYDPNTKNFGPRVGLAWAPAALQGKTTIRTGFGIYYGGNQNDDFSDAAESAVPRYSLSSADFANLAYPLVAFLDPRNQLFSPKAIDRHRKDLSYENWDFMVQQQLPNDWLVQLGYTGSEGHHLFDRYTINLINPLTGKRPLAGFGSFGLKANDANNNFNALQASLHRRFSRGLMLQMNYMWSHGIADGSIGAGESIAFQNQACRACDRSNSSIDVRHNMTASGIYQLPFGRGKKFFDAGLPSKILGGWELAGIASARTGLPVNITMTRKATALLDGNTSSQRPNLVPGVPIYAANQTINNWFNPAAFALPANGTWGNLGRYIADGPGMYEIDSSLQKRFRITERLGLNFRAAAYNLFNHPIFKNPSSGIGALTGNPPAVSGSFGRITSIINTGAVGTGAPRRIEFMFRAEF